MMQIFDIETARDLFGILEDKFKVHCSDPAKSPEDISLILMLANHLREWIAPGYNLKNDNLPKPQNPAEEFSKAIFEDPDFYIVRQLCNGTKHVKKMNFSTDTEYEANMHGWTNLHKVRNMHKGQAIRYLVDGAPIESIIEPLIAQYKKWFSTAKG